MVLCARKQLAHLDVARKVVRPSIGILDADYDRSAPAASRFGCLRNRFNLGEGIGEKLMVLTLGDLEILKQLRGAGARGRNVRELNVRVTLDRLVKGGYLVGRPLGRDSVQYRITQRGQDAIVEHDL
jgi:hypothetical protein